MARWTRPPRVHLPVSACSDDAEVTALDRISMADWMNERGLSSPRLRWWVNYALPRRLRHDARTDQRLGWFVLLLFARGRAEG
jgi:hypothetical protein